MAISIKNGGYAFLIRLDLMLPMSLWKEFQLLQILNDLSIKHLIKLILYRSIFDMFKAWDFDYWYLKWIHQPQWRINEDSTLKRKASIQSYFT